MPRLPDFRDAHPEIDLVIDPNSKDIPPKPGGADVALRYGAGAWPGMISELLLPSGVVVVAAPRSIGPDAITDLDAMRVYPWPQGLGTSEASDWITTFGLTGQSEACMTSLPGNRVLDAVRAGHGVTVLASVSVNDNVAAGRLIKLREDRLNRGYYIVTHPGPPRRPLKAFLRWLRKQGARAPRISAAPVAGP